MGYLSKLKPEFDSRQVKVIAVSPDTSTHASTTFHRETWLCTFMKTQPSAAHMTAGHPR
jgi:alkyl hydroperoxide reductase subunit AhpC